MILPEGPLVAWYGDDFTGSAAVMEVLTFAGLPAVLFFAPPTPERLARFPAQRGVGIAGDARSRGPDWMAEHLPRVFAALRATGAPILHYKVCSTLDSAPHVGSIGAAADLALAPEDWAPLLVAAPEIGRWQAFGTLFAAAGREVHRLDRHPTMSVHPITPMDEADVRRHLERQTARRVGLVDVRSLKAGLGLDALQAERDAGRSIVALDIVDDDTLAAAGRLIWEAARSRRVAFGRRDDSQHAALHGAAGSRATDPAADACPPAVATLPASAPPLVAIGSQGVEYALVAAWRAAGHLGPASRPAAATAAERVAVVSGSCSPVSAQQIRHAEADGFTGIRIDPRAALDARGWNRERGRAVAAALDALGRGRSPIVFTALGPDDPAVSGFREAMVAARVRPDAANAAIGTGLGDVLRQVVEASGLRRAAIAGGDTSSAAAGALGLWAVTAEAALAPGAALLRGHGDGATDGIEIALKGGQMGPPDFFARLRAGGPGGGT